jgi:hypothetical protein
MKIKARNSKVASMKLCVPVDGVIDIDANGVAEVSPKCAAVLVKGTNDWDYVKKAAAEKEVEEEEDDTEDVGEDLSDRERFSNWLDSLSVSQMKDYAKEGNLPEDEYEKLSSKKLMKAYLLKKYDEAPADEKEE